MTWTSILESLPVHNQEVLLKANDLITLAVFDGKTGKFHLSSGRLIGSRNAGIYWSELLPPAEEDVAVY